MGGESNQFDSSRGPAEGPVPRRTTALVVDDSGGGRDQTVTPGCTLDLERLNLCEWAVYTMCNRAAWKGRVHSGLSAVQGHPDLVVDYNSSCVSIAVFPNIKAIFLTFQV